MEDLRILRKGNKDWKTLTKRQQPPGSLKHSDSEQAWLKSAFLLETIRLVLLMTNFKPRGNSKFFVGKVKMFVFEFCHFQNYMLNVVMIGVNL